MSALARLDRRTPDRRVVTAAPERSLVPALARQEARRLLLHPLVLLGFGIWILNGVRAIIADGGPREAFETIDSMVTFYPGVFMILAANLVATRDRRAGSGDMLSPLPGRPGDRILALVVASFAPAVLGLGLILALDSYFVLDDRYFVAPGFWHIVQGPVTLVGGSLLGIMIAAWAPARGAAVIGMVGIVAANVWLANQPDGMLFGPVMTWPIWGIYADQWGGINAGSPAWHVVYLLGLCGMAAAAAWVRFADRRTPAVVLGIASVAVAVLGGIGQLP